MNAFDELIHKTNEIIEMSKENYEAAGIPDYLIEMEQSSLRLRMEDLKKQKEQEDLFRHEELEVAMYPQDLPSGQVSIRTLTTVLGGLQTITDSVANTLLNQASSRGPIPQNILERNSWVLRATKAGSFIAVLDLDHDQHLVFEDEDPQQKIITKELFNLFNASDEEESLLEAISSLGERTLRHYAEWTKSLKELGTPISINWRSEREKVSTVAFDSSKAENIYTILHEKLTSREEEIVLTGRLTGLNVRTGSFEFVTLESQKISGRILKEAVPNAIKHLDKRCYVDLLKITTTSSAGKEKITWKMNNSTEITG
ncbi:hypothetical protein ACTHSJ_25810 [Paenibacillus cellulositrophicus]|uniref:hypothetical protein n=1 Tax=Paenibacillus cellulositrophicus TaxID=562959 RepID=UPI003F7EAEAD